MSAWRDQYQKGSFRGAPFRTASHERSGGRRGVTHELPGRDEPVVEDLGRRARSFSIDCHVIGDDYRAPRDALIDALEAEGPGLLIHPWHGSMMVVVNSFTQSESTEEGGVTNFSIEFGEAGTAPSAPVSVAAGNDAARTADAVNDEAPDALADDFSIEDAAEFVEQSAADLIAGMAEVSQLAAGLRGGVGPTLRAFDAGLRFLPDNMARLLRAPIDLGRSIVGLVQAVSLLRPSGGVGGGARSRLAPLERMLDWTPPASSVAVSTPQRQQEATNQAALVRVFHSAAAAELVRTAAAIDWPSYEDAAAARDTISERLDVLALEAADRGADAEADAYDRLRRALVRDIAAKGATLARVYRLALATTEPALAVAHRLYGGQRPAVEPEARALSIAARNRIPHPGFIPGGVELELLTRDRTAG